MLLDGRQTQVAGSRLGLFGAVLRAGSSHLQQQLAQKLEQERQVKLSADRIRRLMKKGWRWKRTRHSHKHKQDPIAKAIKQADFDTLKQAEREGHLLLKYLDESGFCLWSPVSYSYSRMGEQSGLNKLCNGLADGSAF